MSKYYCIYSNGQLMETKLKKEWTEKDIIKYAWYKYGASGFITGLEN